MAKCNGFRQIFATITAISQQVAKTVINRHYPPVTHMLCKNYTDLRKRRPKIMADKNKNSRKNILTAGQTIAQNKRARYDYALETPVEAGIQLTGSELKSLRAGLVSIGESYVSEKDGELYLLNATIQEYTQSPLHSRHAPTRPRKLLLHKREIGKFIGAISREGYTLIPTKLYFNDKNMVKLEIALGKGKKLHDKRATEKDRDWGRAKNRVLKNLD